MADYVERYSGKASDELEKQIRRVYKQAAEEVQKKLDDFISGHKARNAQMLQMVSDGKMSKQDYQRWMRGQVFQGDQWKQKLKDVTEVYVHADEKAREIVGGTSKNVFMEAANYTAYDLEKGMRGAVAFNVYDAKTVERLLKKDPKMLPEWKIDQPKDYKWNEKRVRNAVAQGIIQGESVEEVGDRLTGELATSNATKMDMFARTAINGAQNAGRMDRLHEAEEMGIEVRKKWLATLDQRTRDTHQALDGQEQPIDEPFVVDGMKIDYPGDPFAPPELVYNCRCTLTYVYPKYQHLQHNHERRDQLNDKNIENMTYYEWLGLASKNDRKQEESEQTEKIAMQTATETTYVAQTTEQYIEWQKNNSTRDAICRKFEEKYGVQLNRETMPDGTIIADLSSSDDKYISSEKKWLYEIFEETLDDISQVSAGRGHCGYIQSADGSKAINAYLRRGEIGMYKKSEMQKTIDAMNRLIEQSTISENISVDRCAGIDALERMGIDVGAHGNSFRIGHAFCTEGLDVSAIVDTVNKDYIGTELVDSGFMSASVVRDKNIFGGSDVTFTLRVPQGTHAYISDNLIESEIVFSPNTRQRIVGAKEIERKARGYDGQETTRKVVEIILEVIKD